MTLSVALKSTVLAAVVFAASMYAAMPFFAQVCLSQASSTCAPVGAFCLAVSVATFTGMISYYSIVGFKFESKADEPPALMWLVLLLMTISRTQVFWYRP